MGPPEHSQPPPRREIPELPLEDEILEGVIYIEFVNYAQDVVDIYVRDDEDFDR